MTSFDVTKENLPQAVEFALRECMAIQDANHDPEDPILARDLMSGIHALQLIKSELLAGNFRPRNQRSGAFIRYVIDEESGMAMGEELKKLIVKIEDVYKRF